MHPQRRYRSIHLLVIIARVRDPRTLRINHVYQLIAATAGEACNQLVVASPRLGGSPKAAEELLS